MCGLTPHKPQYSLNQTNLLWILLPVYSLELTSLSNNRFFCHIRPLFSSFVQRESKSTSQFDQQMRRKLLKGIGNEKMIGQKKLEKYAL